MNYYLFGRIFSSVATATGYELDNRGTGVQFPAGQESVLFSTAFRWALGPIQAPIQRTAGLVPPGVGCRRGAKLFTHPHLVPLSRMVELYLHSPTRLHGLVVTELNTGT
jgi:hypothetical protein